MFSLSFTPFLIDWILKQQKFVSCFGDKLTFLISTNNKDKKLKVVFIGGFTQRRRNNMIFQKCMADYVYVSTFSIHNDLAPKINCKKLFFSNFLYIIYTIIIFIRRHHEMPRTNNSFKYPPFIVVRWLILSFSKYKFDDIHFLNRFLKKKSKNNKYLFVYLNEPRNCEDLKYYNSDKYDDNISSLIISSHLFTCYFKVISFSLKNVCSRFKIVVKHQFTTSFKFQKPCSLVNLFIFHLSGNIENLKAFSVESIAWYNGIHWRMLNASSEYKTMRLQTEIVWRQWIITDTTNKALFSRFQSFNSLLGFQSVWFS